MQHRFGWLGILLPLALAVFALILQAHVWYVPRHWFKRATKEKKERPPNAGQS